MSAETPTYTEEQVSEIIGPIEEKIQSWESNFVKRVVTRHLHEYEKKVLDGLNLFTEKEKVLTFDVSEQIQKAKRKEVLEEGDVFIDEVTARIQASESLALWHLVMSDEFHDDVRKMARQPNMDVATAAGVLGWEYLSRITARNKEKQMYQNPYIPTVGLEVEFPGAQYKLMELRKKRDEAAEKLNRVLNIQEREDKLSYIEREGIGKGAFEKREEGTPEESKKEISEVAFLPTASPKTQLRELLILTERGVIPKDETVTIHTALVGVRLDRENTEVMQLSALMDACAYTKPLLSKSEIQRLTGSLMPIPGMYQSSRKASLTREGEFVGYPLHKTDFKQTIPYKKRAYYTFSGQRVEVRANTNFENFSGVVRQTDSMTWLSAAIRAKQVNRQIEGLGLNLKDKTRDELANIWDETQAKLNTLFEKHEIILGEQESIDLMTEQIHKQIERGEPTTVDPNLQTPYNNAMGKIALLSQNSPEFAEEARKILIGARAAVKKTLAEVKPKPTEGIESGTNPESEEEKTA